MVDFWVMVLDVFVIGTGRRVTALVLPASVRESHVTHTVIGYAVWIGVFVLVVLVL